MTRRRMARPVVDSSSGPPMFVMAQLYRRSAMVRRVLKGIQARAERCAVLSDA